MTTDRNSEGAVAWQVRYVCPIEGAGEWNHLDSQHVDLMRSKTHFEVRPLIPAAEVQALVERLRKDADRLDKGFGPGDMIIAATKRGDADELANLIPRNPE